MVERAGNGFEHARRLQFALGLDPKQDAVICPWVRDGNEQLGDADDSEKNALDRRRLD